jgi:hypothetical protein
VQVFGKVLMVASILAPNMFDLRHMVEVEDRDKFLHELYSNRNYYEFIYGKEWFEKQAYDIHWNWLQSGTWLKIDDTSVTIAKVCWECHHKYDCP